MKKTKLKIKEQISDVVLLLLISFISSFAGIGIFYLRPYESFKGNLFFSGILISLFSMILIAFFIFYKLYMENHKEEK